MSDVSSAGLLQTQALGSPAAPALDGRSVKR